MYRVLLVEDEDIIRNGLVHSIDWAGHGFEVVASAEDGDEAWEKYLALRPDVIITDIKMPQSSGLDLLDKVKRHNPDVFVLLISGHEEFEYARTAIRHGAFEYILKLNVMDVIDDILSRLAEQLRKRVAGADEMIALKQHADARTLELMVRGEAPGELIAGAERILMVAIYGAPPEQNPLPERAAVLRASALTLFVMDAQQAQPSALIARIKAAGMACGVSGVMAADEALFCFYQALKDLDKQILKPRGDGAWAGAGRAAFEDAAILEQYHQIPDMLSAETHFAVHADAIYLPQFRSLCHKRLTRLFQGHANNPQALDDAALGSMLLRFFSMAQMRDCVVGRAAAFCEAAIALKGDAQDDIAKAVAYIDSHYHEDIDAMKVAKLIYLSPQHFSSKFKSRTGQGFSAYLRTKRITRACELLTRGDTPIADIAVAVGYADVKYFYRVFRQQMGQSPNAYRRQPRNEAPKP